MHSVKNLFYTVLYFSGVRPYKCALCEKSFTQRCSLESHCLKVHGVTHVYDYKQRRSKVNKLNICLFSFKRKQIKYILCLQLNVNNLNTLCCYI
jgi:hypothetical protein